MNDEAIYYVDYIYDSNDIKGTDILEIAELEDLWGKDIDEPFIAVHGLKITPDMVTIYDKRGYTIKIKTPSGVDIIKFRATEEECEIFQTNNKGFIEVDIIGRCSKNEWMGNISPQIFLEDFQVIDSNKYYF